MRSHYKQLRKGACMPAELGPRPRLSINQSSPQLAVAEVRECKASNRHCEEEDNQQGAYVEA
jgi:hypothetical protein